MSHQQAEQPSTRVAVVQDAPVLFDMQGTLDRLDRLTAEAAEGGARLALFPEAFIGGYPQGLTFGAGVGSRTPQGHELYRHYWDNSLDLDSPDLDRVAGINRVHLAVGAVERESSPFDEGHGEQR